MHPLCVDVCDCVEESTVLPIRTKSVWVNGWMWHIVWKCFKCSARLDKRNTSTGAEALSLLLGWRLIQLGAWPRCGLCLGECQFRISVLWVVGPCLSHHWASQCSKWESLVQPCAFPCYCCSQLQRSWNSGVVHISHSETLSAVRKRTLGYLMYSLVLW